MMSQSNYNADALPWGWELRANKGVFEDSSGRTWSTVRDAFWVGELGFPSNHVASEQQELLTRVLTAIGAERQWGDEQRFDFFEGDMLFWDFYLCWLASIVMLEISDKRYLRDTQISARGRSVLMMLQATRDPAWEALPMTEVIAAVATVAGEVAPVVCTGSRLG
ncbi:hypothetical protein [Sphingomonas oligophenolica]|uniref:Uncharacterized protein n=1 Tax=Sphingomonas oligophenolica TaxID=301154 RepID=A0A502BUE2_9SPHN|nr:hypothetical protein [Sphingomonas oligophenolica]TPG03894.1 hypothetical protein EAH84_15730 [Sphingomonas oligophenolica]